MKKSPTPSTTPATPVAFEFIDDAELRLQHRDADGKIKIEDREFDLSEPKTILCTLGSEVHPLLGRVKNLDKANPDRVDHFYAHIREGKNVDALTKSVPIKIDGKGCCVDGIHRLLAIRKHGRGEVYVQLLGGDPWGTRPFNELLKQLDAAQTQWANVPIHAYPLPTRMPDEFASVITDDQKVRLQEIVRAQARAHKELEKWNHVDVGRELHRRKQALIDNPHTGVNPPDLEALRVEFTQRRTAILAGFARQAVPEYLKICLPAIAKLVDLTKAAIMTEVEHDTEQCKRFGLPQPPADFATNCLRAALHKAERAYQSLKSIPPNVHNFGVDRELLTLLGVPDVKNSAASDS